MKKANKSTVIVFLTLIGLIIGLIVSQFNPIFHPYSWGSPFDDFHLKIMPIYLFTFSLFFFILSLSILNLLRKYYIKKSLNFLSKNNIEEISKLIAEIEKESSAEIRVHISSQYDIDDPLEVAKEWFGKLKMDKTVDRNGVLLFIAPNSRKFAIYGDININDKVGEKFWSKLKDRITELFSKKQYKEAIIYCLSETGDILKNYFPIKQGDKNELSDKVTFS